MSNHVAAPRTVLGLGYGTSALYPVGGGVESGEAGRVDGASERGARDASVHLAALRRLVLTVVRVAVLSDKRRQRCAARENNNGDTRSVPFATCAESKTQCHRALPAFANRTNPVRVK